MVSIIINGTEIKASEDMTILDAAKTLNIRIPTLCYLDMHDIKAVNQGASCRVCVVELEGRNNLVPACATYVTDGMKIRTHSPKAVLTRRIMVELLLSNHPFDCLVCEKNTKCDLQSLAAELGIRGKLKYSGEKSEHKTDSSSKSLFRNPNKCIMCRRCETMCNQVQTCGILSAAGRGFDSVVVPAYNLEMKDTMCTFCGQCVSVCPTAALTQINSIAEVWEKLSDTDAHVVVQTAPAVRVALGEEFGMTPGTSVTGKMVSLLRRLGFDKVFDTNFGADLTVMEEAAELIHRLKEGGPLPILTSCCPAWVKFIEHQFPDLLDIPSTCKSPHEMLGTMIKTYYAEKAGIPPEKIVVVSVMPCIAKKYEVTREEFIRDGVPDVDYVLSTRELAMMAREAGIDFASLPDSGFDSPLGLSTGAGVIFGAAGGVIEAALRTAGAMLGENRIEFTELRGMTGLRTAEVKLGGYTLKTGVAHGLGNARELLESIQNGEHYDAIEIMACPGGCVAGGGQPYHHGNIEIIRARMNAIHDDDKRSKLRVSCENEEVQRIYREYLGEPYGEKAHELLHTYYKAREFI